MPKEEFTGRLLISAEKELVNRYTERRRAAGQPGYQSSPKNRVHFEKCAELIVSIGANPSLWVDAQFEGTSGETVPQPNHLYSEAACKRYSSFNEAERCPPKLEIRNQEFYLTNYVRNVGLSEDEALLADWTAFRSFFRVLRCSEMVLPEAMRKFGKAALSQVRSDSSLLRYLSRAMPGRVERLIPTVHTTPIVPESAEDACLPPATCPAESWENRPQGASQCR